MNFRFEYASQIDLPRDTLSVVSAISGWRLLTLAALAATWAAMLSMHGNALDKTLFHALYAAGHAGLISAAEFVSELGTRRLMYPLLGCFAMLLGGQRQWTAAILLVVIPVTCRAIVDLQKEELALVRPSSALHLVKIHTLSFPSGHTANSTSGYLSFALLVGRMLAWRHWLLAAALTLSGSIGLSRVMLGVHWPSDVVGGWAFGAFWTLACLWLADAVYSRLRRIRVRNYPDVSKD